MFLNFVFYEHMDCLHVLKIGCCFRQLLFQPLWKYKLEFVRKFLLFSMVEQILGRHITSRTRLRRSCRYKFNFKITLANSAYPASSWFLLRFPREKPLRATVILSECAAAQRQGFKPVKRVSKLVLALARAFSYVTAAFGSSLLCSDFPRNKTN